MIEATSELVWYQTQLGNGVHSAALIARETRAETNPAFTLMTCWKRRWHSEKSELASQGACLTIQSCKLPTAQLRLAHAESPAGR